MNPLKGLSIAEKIVWCFEHRATEAHRSAIERPLGITPEQFEQAIPRARDIGIENGLRITPIYEREGWWTANPTRRIAAIAVLEAAKRNLGEAQRNARVYDEFGGVGTGARFQEAALGGSISALRAELPELQVSASADFVLNKVDAAIDRGRGFVEIEAAA